MMLRVSRSPIAGWLRWAGRLLPRRPGSAGVKAAAGLRGPGAAAAFSPTRAQSSGRHIVGRRAEVEKMLAALLEERAHVVLFSERGRGKTSLTNLAVEGLRQRGAVVARYTCEAGDEFDAMIRGLMRGLPRSLLTGSLRRRKGEGCEALLPQRPLRAGDVVAVAEILAGRQVIFVVDEFDRTRDMATRTRIADTMKLLSDRGANLHFVLVAVSATVEEILGEHPSVQRNLLALHLPLLTDADVRTMLTRGGEQADVVFTEDAMALVTAVARGMPYMAQLLGLRIAQAALRRDAESVAAADLEDAVHRLIEETPAAAKAIHAALLDVQHEDMDDVLRQLGMGEQDRLGELAVEDGAEVVTVGGVRLSRNAFALLLASGVLARSLGEAGVHVGDRGVMYYVQLLAARDWLRALPAAA